MLHKSGPLRPFLYALLLGLPLILLAAPDRHYPAKNRFDAWLHRADLLPGITFRQPLYYTFFEFQGSVSLHGFSGLNVFAYDEGAMGFDSTEIYLGSYRKTFLNRSYFDMDLSIVRHNFLARLIDQNYIDYLNGFGVRRSMQIFPLGLNPEWQNELTGLAVYNFRPQIDEFYLSQTLYYQPFRDLFLRLEHSWALGAGTAYQTLGADRLLRISGSSNRFSLAVNYALESGSSGSDFLISANVYMTTGYYLVDDPQDLSPISYLNMYGLGAGLSLNIQLGGRKTEGDRALSEIRSRNYLSAREQMNSYVLKHPRSLRRDLALRYIDYCDSMAFVEYYTLGNRALGEFKLEEALNFYDRAFASRNETIRSKVLLRRASIARLFILNALQELQKGNYLQAEAILRSGYDLSPAFKEEFDHVMAYVSVYKARSLIVSGLYERADSYLQLAADQNPELRLQTAEYRKFISTVHLRELEEELSRDDIINAAYTLERLRLLDANLIRSIRDVDLAVRRQFAQLKYDPAQPELYNAYAKLKEDAFRTPEKDPNLLQAEIGMTLVEVLDRFGEPRSRKSVEKDGLRYELLRYDYRDRILELYFHEYYLNRIDVSEP